MCSENTGCCMIFSLCFFFFLCGFTYLHIYWGLLTGLRFYDFIFSGLVGVCFSMILHTRSLHVPSLPFFSSFPFLSSKAAQLFRLFFLYYCYYLPKINWRALISAGWVGLKIGLGLCGWAKVLVCL